MQNQDGPEEVLGNRKRGNASCVVCAKKIEYGPGVDIPTTPLCVSHGETSGYEPVPEPVPDTGKQSKFDRGYRNLIGNQEIFPKGALDKVLCLMCGRPTGIEMDPAQKPFSTLCLTCEVKVRDRRKIHGMDPWEHRSLRMQCSKCMWFVLKGNPIEGEKGIGRCRRHAPTMSGYPAVFPGDWCGDHKVDENKI